MRFFGVRYWTFLFWVNLILAVIHACNGSRMTFLALGMALFSWGMTVLLGQATEN